MGAGYGIVSGAQINQFQTETLPNATINTQTQAGIPEHVDGVLVGNRSYINSRQQQSHHRWQ
jgi:hypothetical protein